MVDVTADIIRKTMPLCRDPDGWSAALNPALVEFEINTDRRVAAFLAQIAQESAQLNRLEENLNYSAAGLFKTFPREFPSIEAAQPFERAPEKIANRVYAGRNGNGDEASGDGWRYRGRGAIQVTGRANYRAIGPSLKLPCEDQPELLLVPAQAARSAASFWQSNGLNQLADQDANFTRITVRINGGSASDPDRRKFWAAARTALEIV
jgi:putative chitinase